MIYVGKTYGGKQYVALTDAPFTDEGFKPISVPILATDYTEPMFTGFCRDMYLQVTAASLASGDSVIVTVEGSLDNSGYDNLSATDATTTIAVDGTTLLYFRDALPGYVRVHVVGTTVDAVDAITVKAFFAVAS